MFGGAYRTTFVTLDTSASFSPNPPVLCRCTETASFPDTWMVASRWEKYFLGITKYTF
jgi:hypothetical protein